MRTISTHESITSGSYQIQIPPNDYLFVISKFNIKKTKSTFFISISYQSVKKYQIN